MKGQRFDGIGKSGAQIHVLSETVGNQEEASLESFDWRLERRPVEAERDLVPVMGHDVAIVHVREERLHVAVAGVVALVGSPELGIEDPYALTPPQLEAATNLLERQAPLVGLYWTFFTDTIEAFRSGDVVVGTGWPIALSLLQIQDRPIAALFWPLLSIGHRAAMTGLLRRTVKAAGEATRGRRARS